MRELGALLCDVDGVLRTWDSVDDIEREHGFAPGDLFATAFAPELLEPAITGCVDDTAWRRSVTETLTRQHGSATAAERLVAAWSGPAGRVDPAVLEILTRTHTHLPVALVNNATTRLESDLDRLDVLTKADAVVKSSTVGHAKPDSRIYRAAAGMLGVKPNRCLFVDDSPGNVRAAHEVGMHALQYSGAEELRCRLDELFT